MDNVDISGTRPPDPEPAWEEYTPVACLLFTGGEVVPDIVNVPGDISYMIRRYYEPAQVMPALEFAALVLHPDRLGPAEGAAWLARKMQEDMFFVARALPLKDLLAHQPWHFFREHTEHEEWIEPELRGDFLEDVDPESGR